MAIEHDLPFGRITDETNHNGEEYYYAEAELDNLIEVRYHGQELESPMNYKPEFTLRVVWRGYTILEDEIFQDLQPPTVWEPEISEEKAMKLIREYNDGVWTYVE